MQLAQRTQRMRKAFGQLSHTTKTRSRWSRITRPQMTVKGTGKNWLEIWNSLSSLWINCSVVVCSHRFLGQKPPFAFFGFQLYLVNWRPQIEFVGAHSAQNAFWSHTTAECFRKQTKSWHTLDSKNKTEHIHVHSSVFVNAENSEALCCSFLFLYHKRRWAKRWANPCSTRRDSIRAFVQGSQFGRKSCRLPSANATCFNSSFPLKEMELYIFPCSHFPRLLNLNQWGFKRITDKSMRVSCRNLVFLFNGKSTLKRTVSNSELKLQSSFTDFTCIYATDKDWHLESKGDSQKWTSYKRTRIDI